VGSKTASYTVTDGDRGALIRFSALGADVTLTLPAAANRAGFLLYVVNDDSGDTTSYGVTVDPNGSETIDGVTTRKGYTGTRVTLLCDGTGWRTVSGKWRYFSGNQTLTLSSNTALTHGLGFRPRMVWAELRCHDIEPAGRQQRIHSRQDDTCLNRSSYGCKLARSRLRRRLRRAPGTNSTPWRSMRRALSTAATGTAASPLAVPDHFRTST
jgi:hypothetical protein